MPFDEKRVHPSFGMIAASRVSAQPGVICFGSRLRHNAFVEVTLREGEESRGLNRDWYYGGKEIVSVRLTETQWASFVSSMNIGFGVPCTIEHIQGKDCGPCPPSEGSIEQARREARNDAKKVTEQLNAAISKLEKAIEAPKKTELREILRDLAVAVGNFPANQEFLYKSFEEHVEKVVVEAKATIEAHVMATALKFPALAQTSAGVKMIEPRETE